MNIIVNSTIVLSAVINPPGNEYLLLKMYCRKVSFITPTLLPEEIAAKKGKIVSTLQAPVGEISLITGDLIQAFDIGKETFINLTAVQQAAGLVAGTDVNGHLFWRLH